MNTTDSINCWRLQLPITASRRRTRCLVSSMRKQNHEVPGSIAVSKLIACAPIVRASVAGAVAAAALFAFASQVVAAEADLDEAGEIDELAEVQVTGSRIQSPNVTSANPVSSITGEELRQLGIVNVAD